MSMNNFSKYSFFSSRVLKIDIFQIHIPNQHSITPRSVKINVKYVRCVNRLQSVNDNTDLINYINSIY